MTYESITTFSYFQVILVFKLLCPVFLFLTTSLQAFIHYPRTPSQVPCSPPQLDSDVCRVGINIHPSVRVPCLRPLNHQYHCQKKNNESEFFKVRNGRSQTRSSVQTPKTLSKRKDTFLSGFSSFGKTKIKKEGQNLRKDTSTLRILTTSVEYWYSSLDATRSLKRYIHLTFQVPRLHKYKNGLHRFYRFSHGPCIICNLFINILFT